MVKFNLLLILILISYTTYSQTPLWIQQIGDSQTEGGGRIVTDDLGNIYVTGYFENTVNFSTDTNITVDRTSQGMADVFIQKIDPQGNLLWVKSIGGSSFDYGLDIAIDPDGYIYIAGLYNGTVDFDPGSNTSYLNGNGVTNTFILKLDTAGQFEWVRGFAGSAYNSPASIHFNPTLGCLLTGSFQGSCNFNPNSPSSTTLSSNGSNDIFIAKFNENGGFEWAHGFGSTSNDVGKKVISDSLSNIYCTGVFRNEVDFDPGPGTNIKGYFFGRATDIFLMKLDSLGNVFWTEAISEPDFQEVHDMKISRGELFLAGSFNGTVDFDFSSNNNQLTAQTPKDGFLLNIDLNSNFGWVKQVSNTCKTLAFNKKGEFYIGGGFTDSIDLDPSSGHYILTSSGASDAYLGKYNKEGDFIKGFSFSGPAGEGVSCVAIGDDDNPVCSGVFYGTTDFYSDSSYTLALTTKGGDDLFVYKIKDCQSDTLRDTLFYCAPYFLENGDSLVQKDSLIYLSHKDQFRCDSVVALRLIHQRPNTSISIGHNKLSSQEPNARYQWLRCNGSAFSIIPGDTNQTLAISQNGDYALVVNARGCTDTSACITISNIGLSDKIITENTWFFPNPSVNGQFYLDPNIEHDIQSVEAFSSIGEKFICEWYPQENRLRLAVEPGTYWVKVEANGKMHFQKLLVLDN